MARKPSPWYRAERGEWRVTIRGEDHCLGPHPTGAPTPKKSLKTGKWNAPKEIEEAFHKLMRGDQPLQADDEAVAAVLDDFLGWCYENRAKRTADRYKDFIQDFVNEYGRLDVLRLNAGHVTAWLNGRPSWNATTKRNAITALQRGFNWAVKNRGVAKNPIKGMEKPEAKRRTQIVTPVDFDDALSLVLDQPFRDLLVVSYDSGSRPQEIKRLEARHVQLDKQRAVIPAEEAKGGIPRAIYFPTERSMEVIARLVRLRPTGPLFLNRRGNAWTGFAVKNRFEDLQIALGLREMQRQGIPSQVTRERIEEVVATLPKTRMESDGNKVPRKPWQLRQQAKAKLIAAEARPYGARICHYVLRHSRITDWLVSGVDSHVVAKLAGHQDSKMIDQTYSHVADDYRFMLENAKKQTGINPKSDA